MFNIFNNIEIICWGELLNIKEINNYVHKSIYLSEIKNKFPLSKYDLPNNEMIISLKYPLAVN